MIPSVGIGSPWQVESSKGPSPHPAEGCPRRGRKESSLGDSTAPVQVIGFRRQIGQCVQFWHSLSSLMTTSSRLAGEPMLRTA